jgi:hypothetical protein
MTSKIIKIEQEIKPIQGCKITRTSLEIPERTTYEEWERIGGTLQSFYRANKFWIGDWLNFGERKYGETFSQAIEETDFEYHTLQNYKWVANKIEMSLRKDNLSFSHHNLVAGMESKEQKKWLDKAEKEGWDVRTLKEQIKGVTEKELDENIKTEHCCPKCGYEW